MDLFDPDRLQGKPLSLDPPTNVRLAELRCPVLAVAGELDFSDVVQTARHLEAGGTQPGHPRAPSSKA